MKTFKVLNTRPAHQADALNKMISERGGTPISLPTLDIMPVDTELPNLNDVDIAIFVSANAVLYGLKEIPNIPVIAVGPGTEKTLKQKGIIDVIIPEQYNSEGILALPELQNT